MAGLRLPQPCSWKALEAWHEAVLGMEPRTGAPRPAHCQSSHSTFKD